MNGTKFAYVLLISLFYPRYECFFEKSGCMYIVVAKENKLAVIDYLIYRFCGLFSVIEMLKEVSNGCGWIPMCSHAIEICFEVRGGDGSALSVNVSKNNKRFIWKKFGDAIFESVRVFFWKIVSDNGY